MTNDRRVKSPMDSEREIPYIENARERGRGLMIKRVCVGVVLVLAIASPLAAQDVRYATSSVQLRADASSESAVVTTVARGSRVVVRACAVQWCWVKYGNKTGYVSERYLGNAPQIAVRGGKQYVNARGNRVPMPLMSVSGPPPGATARCDDGFYSFSQSRSGTCSNHGGVARWL